MENLRVRRAGFAYRRPYEGFLNRYKSLCPQTWPKPKGDPKSAVQTLVNHLKVFVSLMYVCSHLHFLTNYFIASDSTAKMNIAWEKQKFSLGYLKHFLKLKMVNYCNEIPFRSIYYYFFIFHVAFQKRKHELASKIQATYKGLLQRRKYLVVRKAVIRIQVTIN